ncbi:O-antigen ligase family protein [Acinetobacter bereziniae]|uniref:O-antigen ligase family protein n=1 Tax=Acinetobacter bereziniae TaxID=106648 RepID=UPI001250C0B9|nr:O-antigen ligase family protein [Acinetobacter bereziniae]
MFKKICVVFSLLFIFIAWLIPVHESPWVTFLNETFAFLSLISLILFFKDTTVLVPKILLPIITIAFIPLIQYFLGIEYYFETAFLCFLYLCSVFLATIIGFNFADEMYKDKTELFFSWILLLAGVLSSLFSITQWLNLENNIIFISTLSGNRPYGNFSQPNNMATFLIFSFLSLLFLNYKEKINGSLLYFLGTLILFSIALTFSRTAWLQLAFIISIILFFSKNTKKNSLIFFSLFFIISLFTIPHISHSLSYWGLGVGSSNTLAERLTTGNLRLGIWKQMLIAIFNNPWFGYGWDQTIIAQTQAAKIFYHGEQTKSAHNIILDLLVWNGIIVGGGIVIYAIFLIKKIIFDNFSNLFFKLIIICFFVHTLLEYPQNYSFFLLPIFFLFGFLLRGNKNLLFFEISNKITLLVFFIAITLTGGIVRDYMNMRYILLSYDSNDYKSGKIKEKLIFLDKINSLISWILFDKSSAINDSDFNNLRKFIEISPSEYNLVNFIKLLIRSGRVDDGEKYYKILYDLYHVNYTYDDIYKSVKNNKPIRMNENSEKR